MAKQYGEKSQKRKKTQTTDDLNVQLFAKAIFNLLFIVLFLGLLIWGNIIVWSQVF